MFIHTYSKCHFKSYLIPDYTHPSRRQLVWGYLQCPYLKASSLPYPFAPFPSINSSVLIIFSIRKCHHQVTLSSSSASDRVAHTVVSSKYFWTIHLHNRLINNWFFEKQRGRRKIKNKNWGNLSIHPPNLSEKQPFSFQSNLNQYLC